MPVKFRYDTQDVVIQIDILRDLVRKLWQMNGPVPAELAADHDMLWPEREANRLDREAVLAEEAADRARASADRAKNINDKSPAFFKADQAAVLAEQHATTLRADADKSKENLDAIMSDPERVYGKSGPVVADKVLPGERSQDKDGRRTYGADLSETRSSLQHGVAETDRPFDNPERGLGGSPETRSATQRATDKQASDHAVAETAATDASIRAAGQSPSSATLAQREAERIAADQKANMLPKRNREQERLDAERKADATVKRDR